MKKYDIQCPWCNGTFFETNGKFRENVPTNGGMLTAKKSIVDAGWSYFPLYDSTEYADLVCPSCEGQLLDSLGVPVRLNVIGEVTVKPKSEEVNDVMDALLAEYNNPEPELSDKVACPVCGEEYKSKGLRVHVAAKHPEYEG